MILPSPSCAQTPPGFTLSLALPWAWRGHTAHSGHWLPSAQPSQHQRAFLAGTSQVGSPVLPVKANRSPWGFSHMLLLFLRAHPSHPRSEFIYLYLIIDPHFYPANILSFSARGHFPQLKVHTPQGSPDLS